MSLYETLIKSGKQKLTDGNVVGYGFTLTPDNIATVYIPNGDLLPALAHKLGEYGLGVFNHSTKGIYKYVYTRLGVDYAATKPNVVVDLNTNKVDLPLIGAFKVNIKKRTALLRKIRAHTPAVLAYIRLTGPIADYRRNIDINEFMKGVDEGNISGLAEMALSHRGAWAMRGKTIGERYTANLELLIDKHRGALYTMNHVIEEEVS